MSESRTRPHPPIECPKCGDPYGFLHSKPEYRGPGMPWPPSTTEHLRWECGNCGHRVTTPVSENPDAH